MRPIKITMTAFGPYKDEEVIDFTELNGHRLFLVSGNTGAGKTSIFDAICFALFGEASGEDRSDFRMLRSQFASDDVYTSVEFEFELKRRTYRILRQIPHVKDGNKSPTGERYEFVETTGGKETMMVDRYMVRQINERVQSLVGLTKDQFSQIVMLPQGEFRKLLTSDTENKEEILRKIFRTHLYKLVAESLNEKRKTAQDICNAAKYALDNHTVNLGLALSKREGSALHDLLEQEHYNTHQVLEALDVELAYYAEEKTGRRAKLDAETKWQKELVEHYHQAAKLNEQFDDFRRKTNEKEKFELQITEYEGKRKRLALAEKTLPLQVHERHLTGSQEDVRTKEKRFQDAGVALQQAAEAFRQNDEKHRLEESRGERREQIVRELERLARDLPTVQDLENKKTRVSRLETETGKAQEEYAAVEGRLAASLEEKKVLSEQVGRIEQKVREMPEIKERFDEMLRTATVLQEFLKLANEAEALSIDERKQRELYEEAAQKYASLEASWLEGQSGLLAEHLHDGKPCPVCGSAEHPQKAVLTPHTPSREVLELERSDKTERETAYLKTKAKRDEQQLQREAKEQEVVTLGYSIETVGDEYGSLVEAGKNLRTTLDRLKADQTALDQLKAQLKQTESHLEAHRKEKEEKAAYFQDRRTTYLTEKALYEQVLDSVPEEFRSLDVLERRIKESETEKQALEMAWRLAQEQFQQARERQAEANANLAGAEKQLDEARTRRNSAEAEFRSERLNAGFTTEEDYQQAKMPENVREEWKREIDRFYADLAIVRKQVEELEKALKDKFPADLTALSEQLEQLEQQIEATRQSLQQAQDCHERGAAGKEKIIEAEQKWKKAEKEFQLVKDLYDVVRGDNRRKMSFERYLLIEFLDRILQAANLRLQTISGGQFYLVRSDRLEKHGKQSGLGLDVYDNYTGQLRDVKSLSGGEKFNASLCLALGMADVIQAYEGGISLETMFIDEGFGSLDEESLNKAIDTLIQLQQTGRMIGIISHVQELKLAIPAILEVKKAAEGYSYTRFRVN